jgi:hypothetical protein
MTMAVRRLQLRRQNGQLTADQLAALVYSADWSLSLVRYYLLDYDGGNDANRGYVDAAAGATLTPAGLALKTWSRLVAILPAVGNGRSFKVLVKNRAAGATYLQSDGTVADVDLTTLDGYAQMAVWGSSDLTNSATDRIAAGQIQGQAGPGGAGEWTIGAGATSTVFTVAAGALTAEPGLLGMRVRWLTGTLAGQCQMINANTGTQITVGTAFTGAPANGDTFTIERPGVRVNSFKFRAAPEHGQAKPHLVAGIAAVADVAAALLFTGPGRLQVSFCETLGATAATKQLEISDACNVVATRTILDETGATVSLGESIRVNGAYLLTDVAALTYNDYGHVEATGAANPQLTRCLFGQLGGGGSYLGTSPGRLLVDGVGVIPPLCGGSIAGGTAPATFIIGSGGSATIRTRQQGGIRIAACGGLEMSGINGTGGISVASISVAGNCGFVSFVNNVGSSGNTGYGISLAGMVGGFTFFGAGNTITGTLGDVLLPGFGSQPVTSHAAIAEMGSMDLSSGHRLIGSGTTATAAIFGLLCSNQSGGALVQGDIVRSSGATVSGAPGVTGAQADTAANATGVLGVVLTPPATGATAVLAMGPYLLARFDVAPTDGVMSYLSADNARRATVTSPSAGLTRQKLRLGYVAAHVGTLGLVSWLPGQIPVPADGLP